MASLIGGLVGYRYREPDLKEEVCEVPKQTDTRKRGLLAAKIKGEEPKKGSRGPKTYDPVPLQ
jgi:hypothetical protein